jgi:hypothetical protein
VACIPTHIVAVVKSSSDRKNELDSCRHVVFYLLGESPASELMCQRFGTLCSISKGSITYEVGTECSETSEHEIQKPGIHPKE